MKIKNRFTEGTLGLFQSRKGVVTLLVIAATTASTLHGKIDGIAFVAALGIAQAIFCYSHVKQVNGKGDPTPVSPEASK